jgi:uncharacterized protein with FMN-binding domain
MKILSRLAVLLLSTVASFSFAHAASNLPALDPALQLAAARVLKDGTFVGGTYDAYYGMVQVQATVSGGHLVSSKALKFPNHSGTSRSINRQALPYLQQEAISRQSAKINLISGATLTSRAYIVSLRDALTKASQ